MDSSPPMTASSHMSYDTKEIRKVKQLELEDIQKKLNLLNGELKTKQALLKRISTTTDQHQELDSLTTQIAKLEDRLLITADELKTALRLLDQSKTSTTSLEEQILIQQSSLRVAEDTAHKSSEQLKNKQKDCEKYTVLYHETCEQRDKYKMMGQQYQDEYAEIIDKNRKKEKSASDELSLMQRRVEEMKKAFEVDKVELKTAMMKQAREELRVVQDQLSQREAKVKVLEQQLKDVQGTGNQSDRVVKQVGDRLDQLDTAVRRAKQEYDRKLVKEGLLDADSVSGNGYILSSKSEKHDLVGRITQLQADLMHMLKNDQQQVEKIAKYQAYSVKLQDNLATTQQEVKKATDQYQASEGSLDKLRQTHELLKIQSLQSLSDLQVANQSIKNLKLNLEESQQILEAQIALHDKSKKQMDFEVAQLNQHIEGQESIVKNLNEMIESQTSNLQDLKNKLGSQKQSNLQTQSELQKAHQEIVMWKEKGHSEIDMLKETLRASQSQIKSKDVDIQRLQIKIKRLDKEIEMNQTQQSFLQEDNVRLLLNKTTTDTSSTRQTNSRQSFMKVSTTPSLQEKPPQPFPYQPMTPSSNNVMTSMFPPILQKQVNTLDVTYLGGSGGKATSKQAKKSLIEARSQQPSAAATDKMTLGQINKIMQAQSITTDEHSQDC